jgi:hypothetical protein
MSFCDFKGIWWVHEDPERAGKYGGEEPGHRVAIGGIPDNVTILCIDDCSEKHAYYDPQYMLKPERIEVKDQSDALHWILLTKGHPSVIACGLPPSNSGGAGPGSWTAEDNPGGNREPSYK